jgi:hypothetical protein
MEPRVEYVVPAAPIGAGGCVPLTVAYFPDGAVALARGDATMWLSAQERAWLVGALTPPGTFTRAAAQESEVPHA